MSDAFKISYCFYCCKTAFDKLGRNSSCHHTSNLCTSCNNGNNVQQMLSNLLKPSAPFFWHQFPGKFDKQPLPSGLTTGLYPFPNGGKWRQNAHDQAMLKKDRENSLKPYKSPCAKIQETSPLKLEEEWETGDAYTTQYNSLCYY